ncbi:MAG: biotin/lipoyl-binding protein, partial [Caldilineaceae bacterium]|nr:biotin/lipoyl-binding protein [Caldilineaceae bacterium]
MVRLKKVYIANWVMLFIFANFLSACRLGRQPTPTPIPINLPLPNSTPSAPTETYTVQPGEVVQDEVFSGRVTSAREEDLFFRRSGQVTTVYVEDGDLVEQGDLIATLDNEVLEIDLESALLGLAIAKENLADAQKSLEYRRQQAALNLTIAKLIYTASDEVRVEAPNGVTDSNALAEIRQRQVELAQLNLDAIETTVDPVLELNVKRAELSVDRVKQQILEGQIEAPYTGEIRFINLPENGEQLAVQGYAAVARIVD